MQHSKLMLIGAALVLAACKDSATSTPTAGSAATMPTPQAPPAAGGPTFKLDGVAASNTRTGDGEASGSINAADDQLSLTVFGDTVAGMKSGMLTFRVQSFTRTAGTQPTSSQYVRYLDDRGGKSVGYSAKGADTTLTLTKVEARPGAPKEYVASGTLAATLARNPYDPADAGPATLAITEGSFTDVRVIEIGANTP